MKKYKIGELVEEDRKNIPVKPQPDWSSSDRKDEKYVNHFLDNLYPTNAIHLFSFVILAP